MLKSFFSMLLAVILSASCQKELSTIQTNQAPVANAGKDTNILLGTSTGLAALDGSASFDASGASLNFAWRQISGNHSSLENSLNKKTTVVVKKTGTYVYELKVWSSNGTDYDTIVVTATIPGPSNPVNYRRRDFYLSLPLDSVYVYTTQEFDIPCMAAPYVQVSGPATATVVQRWEEWLVKDLVAGTYIFKGITCNPLFDTLAIHVINNPEEPNTIMYTNLSPGFSNGSPGYGAGIFLQHNVAAVLRQQSVQQFYFRKDHLSAWTLLPAQIGEQFTGHFDDNIVVLGSPRNSNWNFSKWQIKIKLTE